MKKIVIIPDVHGRTFWVEPVRETLTETDANIIFLGDYHDPYSYEYDADSDYRKPSIERFKKIIQLKKYNPKRVTLLLGNHDLGYIDRDICSCRRDYEHAGEMYKLLIDNKECFQLAAEFTVNDKYFVFSHAGILKNWAKEVWGEKALSDDFRVVDMLNNAWLTLDPKVIYKGLSMYDKYRGYDGFDYGSPIWSDIRSWGKVKPKDTYGFNVVGHTQLENDPIMNNVIVDLDCRRAFYINEDGDIIDYNTYVKIEMPK